MIESFELTDEHADRRAAAREFCETEVEPHVESHEARGEFPVSVVRAVGEAGLAGLPFDEDVGGAGLDYRSFVVTMEELSRSWKLVAGAVNVGCGLVGYPIDQWGTDWQREEWLGGICTGEVIPALAMTEPGAGSDAASMETTAQRGAAEGPSAEPPAAEGPSAEPPAADASRDGDEFVLSGHKVWSTNAAVADLLLVVARTGGEGHGGLSLIGIPDPGERDGLEFVRNIPCMEGDAAVESEIRLDGVRVPAENVVGEEGRGFRYVMEALDIGRIGTAAQGVGVAQAAFEEAREFAGEREQFGQPIREFQGVGFKLADMATEVEAARLLTLSAADRRDRGERVTQAAAMAKTYATDVAMDVATEAVQVLGSRGYSEDYPVERHMREAKGMQIYEGTNEINRLVIANWLYE